MRLPSLLQCILNVRRIIICNIGNVVVVITRHHTCIVFLLNFFLLILLPTSYLIKKEEGEWCRWILRVDKTKIRNGMYNMLSEYNGIVWVWSDGKRSAYIIHVMTRRYLVHDIPPWSSLESSLHGCRCSMSMKGRYGRNCCDRYRWDSFSLLFSVLMACTKYEQCATCDVDVWFADMWNCETQGSSLSCIHHSTGNEHCQFHSWCVTCQNVNTRKFLIPTGTCVDIFIYDCVTRNFWYLTELHAKAKNLTLNNVDSN